MKITANGIDINYALEGPESAPVVTLSHAMAANLTMWDPQVPALSARYRVLRYDIRGHGGSSAPGGAYTFAQLAEDARALLQALRIQKTHFVGTSIGAMVGQELALSSPEVLASLALCNTMSKVPGATYLAESEKRIKLTETEGMEPQVELVIQRWFTAPFLANNAAAADLMRAVIRATSPKGFIGCFHAVRGLDYLNRLSKIGVPTLVVASADDPSTPASVHKDIHDRINGSELAVINGAHMPSYEQPDAFNEAIVRFLERH